MADIDDGHGLDPGRGSVAGQPLNQLWPRLGHDQKQRIARAGHGQVFGPDAALGTQAVHVWPHAGQQGSDIARQAFVQTQSQQPDARGLGKLVTGTEQSVAAQ